MAAVVMYTLKRERVTIGGRAVLRVELSSSFLVVASEKRVVARAKLQPSPGLRASLLGCLVCLKMPHREKEQLMSDNTMNYTLLSY